ncbi:hypothetical protein [Mucilaginibacter aquariorum]|uniref:DUF4292 domain-containing protein n=1 Tax=Mucilaginibacter aquariorum TaxID=2967225 RepID=A0ABT1SYW4_9SPHI|nr:hypothetical protein [Mucilaginibacter aquariorum]MCQ6957540.1 hypothetical protein [Mucilaginibacter aquariorum]
MESKKTFFKVVLIASVLVGITLAGWSMRNRITAGTGIKQPKVARVDKPRQSKYDSLTVKEFSTWLRQIDQDRDKFTIGGTIKVDAPGDTGQIKMVLPFKLTRSGRQFFYRIGDEMVISDHGVNLNVMNDKKKIFAGPQKPFQNMNLLSNNNLQMLLQQEDYELSIKVAGKFRTFILNNDRHPGCKRYAMEVDTERGKIVKISTTLTSPQEPLNSKKDRYVEVLFLNSSDKADFTGEPQTTDVLNAGGLLKGVYKDYTLIKLN